MQRVPVVAAHFKVTQRAAVFLNGGGSQQAGNNGHALAVGSGIRRFGVNGSGQNFNERFQQLSVGLIKHFVFQQKTDELAD